MNMLAQSVPVPMPFGLDPSRWLVWGLLPWVLMAIAITVVVLWIRKRDRAVSKKSGGARPRCGVNIIEGLPGSGKSFWAVRMICESIITEQRPVYTNLPIKARVLRAYLRVRAGGRYVGFIQPLTIEHFRRFTARFEICRVHQIAKQKLGWSPDRIEADFIALYGEHKIIGEDADWIPWGSKIVIDEAQQWYHQKDQQNEDRNLGSMLSHHRHGWYEVWILTQQPILISKTFRNFNDRTIVATNMGKRPIIPGVYMPIWLMVYHHYSGDRCRNGVPYNEKPDKIESVIPSIGGGHITRLYASETLLGGSRQIRRAFDKTRRDVLALGEEDDTAALEAAKQAKVEAMKSVVRRWFYRLAFIALAMGFGYMWASKDKPPGETEAVDVVAVNEPLPPMPTLPTVDELRGPRRPPLTPETTNAPPQRPQLPPPRLTAVGSGWVQVDGSVIELGGVYRDAKLIATEDEKGISLWSLGPAVLRWSIGQAPIVAMVNEKGL